MILLALILWKILNSPKETLQRIQKPSKYNTSKYLLFMIHKIQYFEAKQIPKGEFLQEVVNEFLAEKGENIIAVYPVLGKSLLVHYKE